MPYKDILQNNYGKIITGSILALWGIYAFLKNYGFLRKKILRNKHIVITGAAGGLGNLFA